MTALLIGNTAVFLTAEISDTEIAFLDTSNFNTSISTTYLHKIFVSQTFIVCFFIIGITSNVKAILLVLILAKNINQYKQTE